MRRWTTLRARSLVAVVVVALLTMAVPLWAQDAGGRAATDPGSASAGAAGDPSARGKRFVEAAKGATDGGGANTAMTAYVMIDLPPVDPSADQRRVAIEFSGIQAEALAKFYTVMCQREAPALARDCALRRITMGTSENVPLGQACRIVEGALVAVCAPSP